MFSFLIIIFFSQLFFVLFDRAKFLKIRQSFVKSVVILAAFIVFSTEILSSFTALNSETVIVWWLAGNLILSAYIFYRARHSNIFPAAKQIIRIGAEWTSAPTSKIYFSLLFVIYSIVLMIAALSPPNTSDSLSYHLARVAHWIQAGSVEFYPTAILRQLYQPPLAEYAILHLQLLTGGDRCANLVQFFCFAACGVTASLIAQQFKQNNSTQTLAALLTATVPMAILQGSSTQNDLVVSLFVLCFFYFFLKAAKSSAWTDFAFAGLSLGAALFSKGTAYVYCFPIGLLIFGAYFFAGESLGAKSKFVLQIFVVLLLAFAVNANQYSRNRQLFGTIVSSGEDEVTNRNISLPMFASVAARNYAVHLGTNSMPINELIEHSVSSFLGSELNNPDSTYLKHPFAVVYSEHEDDAGNLLHLCLLTGALIFAFLRRCEERKTIVIAALSIAFGFLLFCALLRWQPWSSRLHLPLFMLGAAIIAAILAKLSSRTTILLAALCFIGSLSFLLRGLPRALISNNNLSVLTSPRSKLYFANSPTFMPTYLRAASIVKQTGAEEVGLALTVDCNSYNLGDWEYLLWIVTKDKLAGAPRFRHVGVKNVSKRLDKNIEPPEWVISANSENDIDGAEYDEVWSEQPLRILHKHAPAD